MAELFLKERIAYARKHVTVMELFERYGWRLPSNKTTEHPFQVSCPFKSNHAHGDRSKSMRIYPPDGFYCFTCGTGGDIFDLVGKALEEKTGENPGMVKLVKYFETICGQPDLDKMIYDKAVEKKKPRVPKELESAYTAMSIALRDKVPLFSETTWNIDHYMERQDRVWAEIPIDLEGWTLSKLKAAFDRAIMWAEILFDPKTAPEVKEEDEVKLEQPSLVVCDYSGDPNMADEDFVF